MIFLYGLSAYIYSKHIIANMHEPQLNSTLLLCLLLTDYVYVQYLLSRKYIIEICWEKRVLQNGLVIIRQTKHKTVIICYTFCLLAAHCMCVHVSFYLFRLLGVVMRSRQTIQTITQALNIRSLVRSFVWSADKHLLNFTWNTKCAHGNLIWMIGMFYNKWIHTNSRFWPQLQTAIQLHARWMNTTRPKEWE